MMQISILYRIAQTYAPIDPKKAEKYRKAMEGYAARCHERGINMYQ